jgi:hypothetical protein
MKLKNMKTHRVGQKSLEPYRPSKSSQKQSKTADMGQTGYAMEKVTRISSTIIDLKIKNPFYTFLGHLGGLLVFLKKPEPVRKCQNVPDCSFAVQRDSKLV